MIGRAPVADELFDREVGRGGVVLVDDRGLPRELSQLHPGDVLSAQQDAPAVRAKILRHEGEERALAAAVRADEGRDFALAERQVQTTDDLVPAVGEGEVLKRENTIRHSFASPPLAAE